MLELACIWSAAGVVSRCAFFLFSHFFHFCIFAFFHFFQFFHFFICFIFSFFPFFHFSFFSFFHFFGFFLEERKKKNALTETTSHQKNAIRRTTYHSLSLVYQQALQDHLRLLLQHSSQESATSTEYPASTRSGSMSEEVRGNTHGPAETENPNTNVDNEEVRGNSLHDLPEWQEEFKDNLVDESFAEHRDASSSSHELPSEPRAKVVSGKHSIFTHFPKDRNCDICLRTQITSASCRRRTGTVVPRAEHFGDLITADHKFLSEEIESRNNLRHAVVVQDWATQWLQSYPCKTRRWG